MKVVRLSVLRTGRLYTQEIFPVYSFLLEPERHRAAGRIRSMKNFNDTMGSRTRDLPVRSAVPQPTAPDNRKAIVLYTYSIMLSCSSLILVR